jgi:hypothetical protein
MLKVTFIRKLKNQCPPKVKGFKKNQKVLTKEFLNNYQRRIIITNHLDFDII